MRTCAVVLAAGKSQRFGEDKLWIDLNGKPLWTHSFQTLAAHPEIEAVGIVCQSERIEEFFALAPQALFIAEGGATRQESSRIACESVPDDFDAVLLHDAARPFVSEALIDRVVQGVQRTGAAFPSIPVTDTVKQGSGDKWSTLDRSSLVAVQTPQGALRTTFLQAHHAATREFTDDVSLIEALDIPVEAVIGEVANFKATHPDDLSRMIGAMETRTGFGYDVHAFSTDPARPLWLGGIEFDERPGLDGHSDADVLLHAIVDALLGAVGLGDIGIQYPNTDPRWKGAPSSIFLQESAQRVRDLGWTIVNIDATVLAERPKMSTKRELICQTVASLTGVSTDRVSVKATTHEGLGAIGRGEGIVAQAVVTLTR